jgi:hypothetical protein
VTLTQKSDRSEVQDGAAAKFWQAKNAWIFGFIRPVCYFSMAMTFPNFLLPLVPAVRCLASQDSYISNGLIAEILSRFRLAPHYAEFPVGRPPLVKQLVSHLKIAPIVRRPQAEESPVP